jgi:hypothetical protein
MQRRIAIVLAMLPNATDSQLASLVLAQKFPLAVEVSPRQLLPPPRSIIWAPLLADVDIAIADITFVAFRFFNSLGVLAYIAHITKGSAPSVAGASRNGGICSHGDHHAVVSDARRREQYRRFRSGGNYRGARQWRSKCVISGGMQVVPHIMLSKA